MSKNNYFFTSESVTEGHPDKVADAISGSVLDAIMAEDTKPNPVRILTTLAAFVVNRRRTCPA